MKDILDRIEAKLDRLLAALEPPAKRSRGGEADERRAWIEKHASYAEDKCLLWPWGINTALRVWIGADKAAPRRFMCEKAHGPCDGRSAMSTCANGGEGCISPQHLRWMTPSERFAYNYGKYGHHGIGRAGDYME